MLAKGPFGKDITPDVEVANIGCPEVEE